MSIPICVISPAVPPRVILRLPFGVTLQSLKRSLQELETVDEQVMGFLKSISPALSPLLMIANLAKAVSSLFDCVKAVRDAVSELNPSKITECIDHLREIAVLLMQYIPPLNYLPVIRDIIRLALVLLTALEDQIQSIQTLKQRLTDVRSLANSLNDLELEAIVGCSEDDVLVMRGSVDDVLVGVSFFLQTAGTMIQIIGVPGKAATTVPKLFDSIRSISIPPSSLGEEELISLLQTIRRPLVEIDQALGMFVPASV